MKYDKIYIWILTIFKNESGTLTLAGAETKWLIKHYLLLKNEIVWYDWIRTVGVISMNFTYVLSHALQNSEDKEFGIKHTIEQPDDI